MENTHDDIVKDLDTKININDSGLASLTDNMKKMEAKKQLKYNDKFLLLHTATNTYLTLDTQLIPYSQKESGKNKNSIQNAPNLDHKGSQIFTFQKEIESANIMFRYILYLNNYQSPLLPLSHKAFQIFF